MEVSYKYISNTKSPLSSRFGTGIKKEIKKADWPLPGVTNEDDKNQQAF